MELKQLIIRLKQEELEKLVQLAKAVGVSSVEDFAKQKLLGLVQPAQPCSIDGEKWQQLIFELTRLHQELKIFVKESSVNLAEDLSLSEQANTAQSLIDPENAQQIRANDDPLDSLLEKALLKAQEKDRPKGTLKPLAVGEKDLSTKDLPTKEPSTKDLPAKDLINVEEDESETSAGILPDPPAKTAKEDESGASSRSKQLFKEKPSDRSGGFPPKKRQ